MAGMKKKPALFEKYGSKVERYATKGAKKKHEKGESKKELGMESKAEKKMARGKGGRNLGKRGM